MKLRQINYIDFVSLPIDEQDLTNAVLKYADPIEIDCKSWKYGEVKELQQLLSKEIDEFTFDYIAKRIFKFYFYKPYHVVVLSVLGAIESIAKITEIENKSLVTKPDPKATEAMDRVGGFERFGRFPEIMSLCKEYGWTYEYVYNLEWSLAYSMQLLITKQNEFQNEYYKT